MSADPKKKRARLFVELSEISAEIAQTYLDECEGERPTDRPEMPEEAPYKEHD